MSVLTPLTAPSGPAVSDITNTSATLGWTLPANPGTSDDLYTVVVGQTVYQESATSTTKHLTDLVQNTEHAWSVSSCYIGPTAKGHLNTTEFGSDPSVCGPAASHTFDRC